VKNTYTYSNFCKATGAISFSIINKEQNFDQDTLPGHPVNYYKIINPFQLHLKSYTMNYYSTHGTSMSSRISNSYFLKFKRGLAVCIAFLLYSMSLSAQPYNASMFAGNLIDYHMVFTNGSAEANWQGASKGFLGAVALNGINANEKSSGNIPFLGTIYTNSNTLGHWENIINANPYQATMSPNATALITSLQSQLENTFSQINALTVTPGFQNRSAASLNNLSTKNGHADLTVINVTGGLHVTNKIYITGDADDLFVLRWDKDEDFSNGYDGQVKFTGGGAIVPSGGLTAANFVHVAGDIAAGGGGSNPPAPYPQGPRGNNGNGFLVNGGSDFNGGGFFTGYWFTTGSPDIFSSGQPYGKTSNLNNAIFVGGWYSKTTKFNMGAGSSGVYITNIISDGGPKKGIFVDVDKKPVTEKAGPFSVNVMPNPSYNDFSLHFAGNSAEPIMIRLMDVCGRVLSVTKLDGNITYTSLGGNLKGGNYFAEVIRGNQRQLLKLVKLN
jgi:hypothetical protein